MHYMKHITPRSSTAIKEATSDSLLCSITPWMGPVYRNLAEGVDEEVIAMRKTGHDPNSVTINSISIRIVGSLLTMGMLVWAIHSGFTLATDSGRCFRSNDWAVRVGFLAMLLGFLLMMLGLPILADLCLNLSDRLQEDAGMLAATTKKSISKVIAKMFAAMFTMSMLWWGMFMGLRLATEPRRDILLVTVGVVTVIFGLIYFAIGLAIIGELGLDLVSNLQKQEEEGHRNISRLKQ